MNPDEIVKQRLQSLAKIISALIPPGWGFCLMVFPHDEREGRLNYISSSQRKSIIQMLKNFIKNSESNPKSFGSHDTDECPPV